MSNQSNWPRRGRAKNAGPPARGRGSVATVLGLGICVMLVVWAMWHGVIGPRVIAPTPGVVEAPQAP